MLALWILFLLFMSLVGLVLFAAFSNKKAEQLLPPAGSFAKLGSTRLHYVDQGQGPVIVMIHGLAGNLQNFTYGVATLLAQNHRVICVDRPGCGYSKRSSNADASLEAQADTIVSLLDHLQIESAVFVGHSLGGAISLAAAQRHPDKVKALALIAPLTHLPDEPSPAFNLKIIFGPERAPADFAIRGGGILSLKPQTFISASSDLQNVGWSMPAIEAAYASMQTPVHVLFAKEDRILDCKQNGEDLPSRIPGAQITLVTGGHMLPVTQVELCVQFIEGVAG